MCGMYIINGVHGPEPRSSVGNVSSNPHVSARIPRPALMGWRGCCNVLTCEYDQRILKYLKYHTMGTYRRPGFSGCLVNNLTYDDPPITGTDRTEYDCIWSGYINRNLKFRHLDGVMTFNTFCITCSL